jgi:hypothetical protein
MMALPAALGYVPWDRAVRRGNVVLLARWAGCALVSASALVCRTAMPDP